ncbi:MAG: hypothetical protein LQ351_001391 [Letrouitia transgressa]|nr:MAG: hypothetical protein LQ351_001391 [Letrouitia transgressa]
MARLNEPALQVDSVEARMILPRLKLSVNSTQSIRIRSLEGEISHLLSENITLREQIIKLEGEADQVFAFKALDTIKEGLGSKLIEFGNLIQELGTVQRRCKDARRLRRRSTAHDPSKVSQNQETRKTLYPRSEITGEDDSRLPPILENKSYPRRTLNAEELDAMLSNVPSAIDSPDLGPPPIAHFEEGDPIKLDAFQLSIPERPESDVRGLHPNLLANLETRRKRRGSSNRSEAETTELDHNRDVLHSKSTSEHLKTGAKRKLNVNGLDEHVNEQANKANDDFRSGRSPETQQKENRTVVTTDPSKETAKESSSRSSLKLASHDGNKDERSQSFATASIDGRKALGPKTTNTDPTVSPRKRSVSDGSIVPKAKGRINSKENLASQRFARSSKPDSGLIEPKKGTVENPNSAAHHSRTTRARSPCTSPVASGLKASTNQPRDTPPPAELSQQSANTDTFGSVGRASRRQRGAISYTEPNLRDKMRRPTKDLVDAVGTEERQQQTSNVKSENNQENGALAVNIRTVFVKREVNPDESVKWKSVARQNDQSIREGEQTETASPLENKTSSRPVDLPPSVLTERRRRTSILDRTDQSNSRVRQNSVTGAVMPVQARSDHTARPEEPENRESKNMQKEAENQEKSDIYDLNETPPLYGDGGEEGVNQDTMNQQSRQARVSRRHSSVSADRVKDAMARRAERRREGYKATKENDGSREADLKSARSVAQLLGQPKEVESRGERAASRRRSMML